MRPLLTTISLWLALLLMLAAPLAHAASELELAVIVHPSTRVAQLSSHELEAIFTRSQTRWDDGTPMVPLNAPPNSELRTEFDRVVLNLDPTQVGRFWLDRRIRGLGLPPKQVSDPGLTLRVVQNLRGSIGYVPASLASPVVKVVARIRQGKVVSP